MFSVLMVQPEASVPGGVSVFCATVQTAAARSRFDSLIVGSSGRGGEAAVRLVWRLLATPVALAWRLCVRPYDVVHINPSFDAKSLIRDGLLLLAARVAGCRSVLFYLHGWNTQTEAWLRAWPWAGQLVAWVLNHAAVITVLASPFRDALIALGVSPDKIIVTRTMFDGKAITAVGVPVATERRRLLFMSRFDREKGARELLQAFEALAPAYPDCDLVLAGDGDDRAFLQAQAAMLPAGRVVFPGYVQDVEKYTLLRDCALFALPSFYRSEGMPVAVLEAMGAGKPVLVGAAGALPDLVTDGVHGVRVTAVTAQTVEAGLRRLLDDPAWAAACGARNAAMAWKKFEAAAVVGEIEEIYAKVAAC